MMLLKYKLYRPNWNLLKFLKKVLNLLDLVTLTENSDPNSQLKALMYHLGHLQNYYYIAPLPSRIWKYYNICIMGAKWLREEIC